MNVLPAGGSRRRFVRPGTPVYSFDGKRVGELAGSAAGHLKVHRRLRRDYWIPDALVRQRSKRRVVLHIERNTLPRYQRSAPRHHRQTVGQRAPAPRPVAARPILSGGVLLLALLLVASLMLVACDGDDSVLATPAPQSTPVAGGEAQTIVATAGGFDPDALELTEGGMLTIRNGSDEALEIVVNGTTGEDAREIGPGGTATLVFDALGAQVITIAEAPDAAATIMVVPAADAE